MSETLKRAKMEFRIQNGSRCSLRLGKGMYINYVLFFGGLGVQAKMRKYGKFW